MATHSSVLAWRIPRTAEPGGLPSMGPAQSRTRLKGLSSSSSSVHAKSLQLCPTLCDPMGCSPPVSSVHGILQARILERVAIPFSRDPPNLGIEPSSLVARVLQADSLLLSHQWSLSLVYRFFILVCYWPNKWKKKAIEAGQGRGTRWAAMKWSSGALSRAKRHSQGSVIGGGSPWGGLTWVEAALLVGHPRGAGSGQLSASSWGNRLSEGVTWVASLSRILSFSGPLFPKNI